MAISWTARRQITYFLIFAIVVLGALYFVWKGATRPTCSDNKQNQNEEGIDCGGPCSKKCLGEVQNLIVLWTRFFAISSGKYDMAALVKNPNLFLSVSSLKYKFEIRDKDNLPIISREGETFITPGETFPIFETNVDAGSRTPGQAFIEFEKNPQWEWTEKEKPPLVVSRKQFSNELPFPRLTITLENKSVSAVNNISVAAVLYDKDKNAKGVSLTAVDSIAGKSSQEVVFTWSQPLDEEPASIEIFFRQSL